MWWLFAFLTLSCLWTNKIQLEEITEFLQNNDMKIAKNKLKFKKHFKEIILSHRFIQEYIQDCKDLFEFLFFVCICGTFIANTSNLYLAVVMKWIGSYGLLIVLICQVFYHCAIGLIYQNQVSEFFKSLFFLLWFCAASTYSGLRIFKIRKIIKLSWIITKKIGI
jgi:hypothetical protein